MSKSRTLACGTQNNVYWRGITSWMANEYFHREKWHKEGHFGKTKGLESQNKEWMQFSKILRDQSSWKDFLIKSSLSWGVWIRMILRKVMFRQITKIAIFKSVPSYPSLLQKEKIKQKFMNLFHSNKHNLWLIFLFDLLQKFKYKLDFMF